MKGKISKRIVLNYSVEHAFKAENQFTKLNHHKYAALYNSEQILPQIRLFTVDESKKVDFIGY